MNIENIEERLLRTERERDEACAEIERWSERFAEQQKALAAAGLAGLTPANGIAILAQQRDVAREEVSQLHMRAASWPGYNIEAARAEVARLRASQNERAIAELDLLAQWVDAPAGKEISRGAVHHRCMERIADLRAEQAAAPAPVTPPADAPQRPSVEALRKARTGLRDNYWFENDEMDRMHDAVRLLLDDALAARGGAS